MTTRAAPKGSGRLVAVRLADVPLKLRLRGASTAARSTPVEPDMDPADLLFKRLLANVEADGDVLDAEVLRKVAMNPSRRVYWISQAAYEAVMG